MIYIHEITYRLILKSASLKVVRRECDFYDFHILLLPFVYQSGDIFFYRD